jgi:hypothetical protein
MNKKPMSFRVHSKVFYNLNPKTLSKHLLELMLDNKDFIEMHGYDVNNVEHRIHIDWEVRPLK